MNDPDDIYQWRRIDARLTTSGQPDEAQLAAIAALGVRHVVNLGLHSHPKALPDEAASVATLGMDYHHLPVDFDAPTDVDYARFVSVMAAIGEAPVHVHCIANLRVSAFLYRWFRDAGMAEDRARAVLEDVWRPGGVWAAIIGDADAPAVHRIRGRDY